MVQVAYSGPIAVILIALGCAIGLRPQVSEARTGQMLDDVAKVQLDLGKVKTGLPNMVKKREQLDELLHHLHDVANTLQLETSDHVKGVAATRPSINHAGWQTIFALLLLLLLSVTLVAAQRQKGKALAARKEQNEFKMQQLTAAQTKAAGDVIGTGEQHGPNDPLEVDFTNGPVASQWDLHPSVGSWLLPVPFNETFEKEDISVPLDWLEPAISQHLVLYQDASVPESDMPEPADSAGLEASTLPAAPAHLTSRASLFWRYIQPCLPGPGETLYVSCLQEALNGWNLNAAGEFVLPAEDLLKNIVERQTDFCRICIGHGLYYSRFSVGVASSLKLIELELERAGDTQGVHKDFQTYIGQLQGQLFGFDNPTPNNTFGDWMYAMLTVNTITKVLEDEGVDIKTFQPRDYRFVILHDVMKDSLRVFWAAILGDMSEPGQPTSRFFLAVFLTSAVSLDAAASDMTGIYHCCESSVNSLGGKDEERMLLDEINRMLLCS